MKPAKLPRRHFLTRLLGAITGGAWLGAQAEEAKAGFGESPFIGEIRMWAGMYEPYGWRICDGRLLLITEYETLFQLIGTTYGGDGQVTFALPDLRGRAPVHSSATTPLATMAGQETVVLLTSQMPSHSHAWNGMSAPGFSSDPSLRLPAKNAAGSPHYGSNADTTLAAAALTTNGGFQPHENMMPSLCVHFIICVDFGVFPSAT